MTQEDKKLLLIDLCERLPYGVMCQVDDGAEGLNNGKLIEIDVSKELARFGADYYWNAYIDDVKLYLRPLSSMTEEEAIEYASEWNKRAPYGIYPACDWLNAHYFDYRGLIERNLALDCTGLHIYD